jgi:flagellar motility protein MotE (MotC chaperone)
MSRILSAITTVLALNFLVVAGVVGWMVQTKRLDREKVQAIRELLFPPAPAPATQPSEPEKPGEPKIPPLLRLETLLAEQTGRTTAEQVEHVQRTFDERMALLDRQARELETLKTQVEQARQSVRREKMELEAREARLREDSQAAEQAASDRGFADSLNLYNSMPSKQVKEIFKSLDDATIVRYLQSMQPRQASKIIKEFKSPDELERITRVMERMRASGTPSTQPSGTASLDRT